jgi:hypothetical protein
MRTRIACAALALYIVGAAPAGANPSPVRDPAPAQAPGPRTPDGVPAGVIIPSEAGNQAFEFGNCGSRKHATGGWLCTEPAPYSASIARLPHRPSPRARTADYRRYTFTANERAYWGVGAVTYGTIFWEKAGTFNGAQAQVAQAGTVWDGAHTVRYDFSIDRYRSTSSGWVYRDTSRDILPPAPGCTRTRTRTPTYYRFHSSGYDFFMQYHFKLRDCAVSNPSTPDGTFYSPRFTTRVYHCVDSTGTCFFKGL